MQIRYRITLAYTIIVTIILLFLCTSIYYSSYENRTGQFRERLVFKGNNTADLLWKYNLDPGLVKTINKTAPSSLTDKYIVVFDPNLKPVFTYYDHLRDSFPIERRILEEGSKGKPYLFTAHNKDAAVIKYYRGRDPYLIVSAAFDNDKAEWLPKMKLILAISFFFSVAIVIATGYIFSLRLVRSMSDLTNKINLISTDHFSQRLDAGKGKDELQQLAQTINNLLDRLQSSFETQRRFIDNASHELSTPLASVASQLDVALQKERNPEEYKRVLASINDDIKRLGILVRSLLEIAKISGSAKGIELSELRIDELLMRLRGEIKKIDNAYEVKLDFDDHPDDEVDLTIYGNEQLLFSALKNVVHNACKFSNDKVAVVKLESRNRQIVITVKDNGPGIARQEYERIFQPFYRSAATYNIASGSGLGLPLASQILRLYKGTIRLESEVGKGSSFIITLRTAANY